jgi:hypothetical protein
MVSRTGSFSMDSSAEEIFYSSEDEGGVIYGIDLDASERERKLRSLA